MLSSALALLLLLGFAMRLYRFPELPVGLHQDEVSEAYESYCLLHTGADRWGYRLPVYFLSWGSGQNVLQSYLTIPVVAVTGLTRVGARLVPLVCGLLTLPLFFFSMRRWHGNAAAFSALAFLCFSPWQVMLARWGIENSPLPFFMVLGMFTFGRALDSRSRWTILPSLLPFALALYTYGVTVVVLPGLLALLFLIGFREIFAQRAKWLGAFAVFSLASLPIAFFVLKNYITKTNYSFERWLPFSVPLIPITRFSQIQDEAAARGPLAHNLHFLRHGLSDNIAWFQVPGIHPLPTFVLGLAVLGIAAQLLKIVVERRFSGPYFAWLLACGPLLVLFPLNISRGGSIYLPVIAMAGIGAGVLFDARFPIAYRTAYRAAVVATIAVLLAIPTYRFIRAYFGTAYSFAIETAFYPELPAAMEDVRQRSGPGTPIYISDKITLNYVQTLFFMQVDPRTFQHSGATFDHPDFGPYRFSQASAARAGTPLVFLLAGDEPSLCADPTGTVKEGPFTVGVCP